MSDTGWLLLCAAATAVFGAGLYLGWVIGYSRGWHERSDQMRVSLRGRDWADRNRLT